MSASSAAAAAAATPPGSGRRPKRARGLRSDSAAIGEEQHAQLEDERERAAMVAADPSPRRKALGHGAVSAAEKRMRFVVFLG